VRPATVDEELTLEQERGRGHVTDSLEEFLAELDDA
jgi:hypothetical protein